MTTESTTPAYGATLKRPHTIPARAVDFGAVVRMEDGRVGWLWKGKGRDPYRVTCADVAVRVTADTPLSVVKWPAELAVEWIESHDG